MRPLVYVAGPFYAPTQAGIQHNIAMAGKWQIRVMQSGCHPVTPHLQTGHLYGLASEDLFVEGCKSLLSRCDALFLLPGWEDSRGSRIEKEQATSQGLPIFTRASELRGWSESLIQKSV